MPNKKGFLSWIDTKFNQYRLTGNSQDSGCGKVDTSKERDLFPYQKLIKDYLNNESPYRGLLLYHGLGAGKTCASIAVAEGFKNERGIIVMLPASLRSNFVGELKTCGDPLWKLNQHWVFNKAVSKEVINQMNKLTGVSKKIIKKNSGVWINEPSKKANYGSISGKEKDQINEQIDFYINQKYSFIHYNGLQNKHLQEWEDMDKEGSNIFDNKVIIIDEVHNLISRVVGGGTGSRLYNLLMNARNIRLVLLSGTPLINYPYEAGLLLNLLRGYIFEFNIKINIDSKIKDWGNKATTLLRSITSVDQIFIDEKNKNINFTRNPYKFSNQFSGIKYNGFIHKKKNNVDNHQFFDMVKSEFRKAGFNINTFSTNKFLALPDKNKDFDDLFVDKKLSQIINKELFIKRILGTISYYKGARADLFPKTSGIIPIKVNMSDYQFSKYEEIRQIERQKERKKKNNTTKKAGKNIKPEEDNVNSYYRVFSRAFGNFVFPESINRPLPGEKGPQKDKSTKEENSSDSISDIDNEFEDNKGGITKKNVSNKIYEKAKQIALEQLQMNGELHLTPGDEGLNKYSPKFLLMLNNISQSAGPVFVYSQFRGLEGIGIFSLVLKYNGYAPFRMRKNSDGIWEIYEEEGESDKMKYAFYSGTEEEEYKIIIKNIYNNDLNKLSPHIRKFIEKKGGNLRGNIIKVLLATASAAEGISLSNVRQVHITEPYWNPVRIEQVMGRAIRICSHSQLPLKDRNVQVFLYIASMTESQLKSSFTIKTKDKGLTSDEAIYEIAQRKEKITGEIFELMKESAIDCSLNSVENEAINCFSFGSRVNVDENSTVPDIKKEYVNQFSEEKQEKINAIPIRYPPKTGKIYVLNKDNNDVYDFESYKIASDKTNPRGRPIIVGKLTDGDIITFF